MVLARFLAQPTFSAFRVMIHRTHTHWTQVDSKDCLVHFTIKIKTDSLLLLFSHPFKVDWVDCRRYVRVTFTEVPSGTSLFDHDAYNPSNKQYEWFSSVTFSLAYDPYKYQAISLSVCNENHLHGTTAGKRAMMEWLYFTSLFWLLFICLNNAGSRPCSFVKRSHHFRTQLVNRFGSLDSQLEGRIIRYYNLFLEVLPTIILKESSLSCSVGRVAVILVVQHDCPW
jgi:hypothetical protein